MVSRYFMGDLRVRAAPFAASTLPTADERATDIRGASPLLRVAPAEVLDDPLGVADHLAAEDDDGHPVLPRERVDVRPVRAAPRHAVLLDLDPAPPELARDPAARAEPVRRRAAAVQDGAHEPRTRWSTSSTARAARPASRHGSGWWVPARRSRSPSRSWYQRTVASTVSSCGRVVQPSSRRARLER